MRRLFRGLAVLSVLLVPAVTMAVSPAGAARLDPSFGGAGTVIHQHGGTLKWAPALDEYAGQPYAMAIDSKDRILVGGGSGAALLVVRYLPDGSLDESFGQGGEFRFFNEFDTGTGFDDPDFSDPRVKAIVARKDGRIMLVAQTFRPSSAFAEGTPEDFLIMLNEDGTRDTTFGVRPGIVEPANVVVGSIPRSAIYDKSGKLLIAGSSITELDDWGYATQYSGYIQRRNADGSGDPDFGGNALAYDGMSPLEGFFQFRPGGEPPYSAITKLKLAGGGRILGAGHDRNRFMLTRLTSKGRLDRTFGNGRRPGISIANFGGRKCFCVGGGDMATTPGGKVVQVGYSSYPFKDRIATIAMVRYLPGGRVDRKFGKNGFAFTVLQPWVRSTSIAIQRNGRILVTARAGYASRSKFMILRFLPDGRPDTSFFDHGRYVTAIGPKVSTAEKVMIDSRGRIVVAGGAVFDGAGSFVLKRFLPNG